MAKKPWKPLIVDSLTIAPTGSVRAQVEELAGQPGLDGIMLGELAFMDDHKLEITNGRDTLLIVGEANANDTRCAACGSFLYSVVRDGKYVHVAFGSLVDEPSLRPTKHIFVGSKAPWFEITDDLPQFEEYA